MRAYKTQFHSMKILRDLPEGVEPPIQASYLNMVMGMFLRVLVKEAYESKELSDESRIKLRKYLERIFDAKDALSAREPKDGFYKKSL